MVRISSIQPKLKREMVSGVSNTVPLASANMTAREVDAPPKSIKSAVILAEFVPMDDMAILFGYGLLVWMTIG